MAGRTQGRPRALGCLALSGAVLALAFPAAAESAFPGENGRIAFNVETWHPPPPPEQSPPPDFYHPEPPPEPVLVSLRIVSLEPDGRRQRRLRTVPLEAGRPNPGPSDPAYSPNGKLIAFKEAGRLAIMRHDGSGRRMLPPFSNGDSSPTWSPNGRRLAFSGQRPCPLYCGTLYSVRPDGSGLRHIMDHEAGSPAWSVNDRIAFLNNDDQYRMRVGPRDGLYSVRSDGSGLRRLYGSFVALGNEPDWSPDGRRLVFRARGRIFTMNADGSGRRPITEGPRTYSDPAWSPDGKYIAAIGGGGEDAYHGLYVMHPNGRGLRKVVDARRTMSRDGEPREWEVLGPPSWQPLPR
jgi:Tol biopolymer transport system component